MQTHAQVLTASTLRHGEEVVGWSAVWFTQCAGHTLSWGGGDASLLTRCYDTRGPTGAPGPLDPTRKHTYAVVGTLCAVALQFSSPQ